MLGRKKPIPTVKNLAPPEATPHDPGRHDPDTTAVREIPSISKLLFRKKLDIPNSSIQKAETNSQPELKVIPLNIPKAPAGAATEPELSHPRLSPLLPFQTSRDVEVPSEPEIGISLPAITPSMEMPTRTAILQPKVLRRRKANPGTEKPLTIWAPSTLAKTKDPMARAIEVALSQGIKQLLFLSVAANPQDSSPRFESTAAVGPSPINQVIWKGLSWNPAFEPKMWNQFVKSGSVEFNTPPAETMVNSTRNVTRAAFGILRSETLTLVRVGTKDSCRGILALVSSKPLGEKLAEVLAHAQALPKTPSKAP